MCDIQIFTNPAFGAVRTLTENGKTLFCGVDIAKPLAYTRPVEAVSRHCRYTLKRRIPHPQNPEKEIEMVFISEGDVYRLIARSKLPKAQEFESWIFDEVLPSIRENGGYIAGQDKMTDEEILARSVLLSQRIIQHRDARIKALTEQAMKNAPKVLFADAVSVSKNAILIGELAKLLKQNGVEKMGQNRLFEYLRNNGYLIRRVGNDYNMPTQRAMELSLFRIKETSITHSDGHTSISKTVLVTGKGQQYFINHFLKRDDGQITILPRQLPASNKQ